jgi:hypothetical protein
MEEVLSCEPKCPNFKLFGGGSETIIKDNGIAVLNSYADQELKLC